MDYKHISILLVTSFLSLPQTLQSTKDMQTRQTEDDAEYTQCTVTRLPTAVQVGQTE
jgi:hypothetical protein